MNKGSEATARITLGKTKPVRRPPSTLAHLVVAGTRRCFAGPLGKEYTNRTHPSCFSRKQWPRHQKDSRAYRNSVRRFYLNSAWTTLACEPSGTRLQGIHECTQGRNLTDSRIVLSGHSAVSDTSHQQFSLLSLNFGIVVGFSFKSNMDSSLFLHWPDYDWLALPAFGSAFVSGPHSAFRVSFTLPCGWPWAAEESSPLHLAFHVPPLTPQPILQGVPHTLDPGHKRQSDSHLPQPACGATASKHNPRFKTGCLPCACSFKNSRESHPPNFHSQTSLSPHTCPLSHCLSLVYIYKFWRRQCSIKCHQKGDAH